MKYAALVMAALLAACGADGLPTAPDRSTPGVALSGEMRLGAETEL
jgi:hypothetical protein